jgi:hypothetical protein
VRNSDTSNLKIKGINLIYLGLLPLLAIICLFHTDERWTNFIYASTINTGFIIYSVFGFFLAGLFGMLFMRFVPLPKTVFWSLVMLFDAPIQILIGNFLGNDFTLSQLVIIDLEIETIGITVASLFVVLKSKKEDTSDTKVIAILVMIFGTILASGYFGSISFQWITQLSLMQQLSYYFAIISTILMYFFAIGKSQFDKNLFAENSFLQFTIKAGLIGVWIYTVLIFVYVILKL